MLWSTAIRTAVVTALWAVGHSLMASLPVKNATRKVVGDRASDGLYRFGFCGVAVVAFAGLMLYLWKLPDQRLYRLRGWKAGIMVAGQGIVVAGLLQVNWQNGLGRVTGIRHLYEYLTGQEISRPPVAQHPLPEGECMEGWRGAFRLSSHPNNYLVILLWWLSPVMTIKWAAIGLVTVIYMVVGSMHEDHRLLNAYGDRYACYRTQVAHWFMLPVDHWRRRGS